MSLINSLLKRILSVGAQEVGSWSKVRSVQLTNAIALITSFLFIILVSYLALYRGWSTVVQVGLTTIALLLSVIGLNRVRWYNLSRALMCIIIPLAVLAAIFLPRAGVIGSYAYFRSPDVYSILITSAVIPLLIFSLRERKALITGLLLNVLILLLFDFIFYRFSTAQQQAPYTLLRFVGANLVILIMFLFLSGSILFFKDLFEHFENKNEQLISRLNEKNRELHLSNLSLHELNQNIEVQNEEIKSQSEELLISQESILKANTEIERQKKELQEKNLLLETSLGEKSFHLLQTNQQLIRQNSELQQFSYTVSHNLRSPVASMKGLVHLYHKSKTDEERAHLVKLFEESTNSLDTIITDLGKIIDIRHDNFTALEKVFLQAEVDLILQSLNTFITTNEVSVLTDFMWPDLVSVKAYINSILFNLISNAIKYRSTGRKPIVRISSRLNGDYIVLEVSDNGLGIDLHKHGTDLFKLYKRFHAHTPGKGLGLFIVKQQIEKLNARIEVESVPEEGTTFRVFHQKNLDHIIN
ncbi:MAG TPA: ATP-binding protein [Cyclobacteriaceae bacterium]|nr:ATP-binding protein [Cyclobacteriaceae bacterium]